MRTAATQVMRVRVRVVLEALSMVVLTRAGRRCREVDGQDVRGTVEPKTMTTAITVTHAW